MTVKKLTVENLRKMVQEAVALQMKQSASDRREKIADDKAKSNKPEIKKESRTVKVTVNQLRSMVKEAVKLRLKENMDMPQPGDLVTFRGQVGKVEDVSPDGKVAVTRDGMRMRWLPSSEVQILATAEDLADLEPEESSSIDAEMGYGANQDPGEDPTSELERRQQQLGGFALSKSTRNSLSAREAELKAELGRTDDVY